MHFSSLDLFVDKIYQYIVKKKLWINRVLKKLLAPEWSSKYLFISLYDKLDTTDFFRAKFRQATIFRQPYSEQGMQSHLPRTRQ